MLRFEIVGNLGADAVVKAFEGGRSAISFPVAHTDKWKDRTTGEMKERTTWVRCTLWRDPDKCGVAEHLRVGKLVAVSGLPKTSAWVDQEGKAKSGLEMAVKELELLGGGGQAQEKGPDVGSDDDLPF